MCYRKCRWEDHEGECRYKGTVPPCERRTDDGEELPDWWDDSEDYEGRDPDALYDEWRERNER